MERLIFIVIPLLWPLNYCCTTSITYSSIKTNTGITGTTGATGARKRYQLHTLIDWNKMNTVSRKFSISINCPLQ